MNISDLYCGEKLEFPSLQALAFVAYINTNKFDLNLCKRVVQSSTKLQSVDLYCENKSHNKKYILFEYVDVIYMLDYIERERNFNKRPLIFCRTCPE